MDRRRTLRVVALSLGVLAGAVLPPKGAVAQQPQLVGYTLNRPMMFSRLDGSAADRDGIPNGELSLQALHIAPGGMLLVDLPSATLRLDGVLRMNAGAIEAYDLLADQGPSLFVSAGQAIELRSGSHIRLDGGRAAGSLTLCSAADIRVEGSSISASAPFDGLAAGTITLLAENRIRVDKGGTLVANGPFGGSIQLASCSTGREAIALGEGRIEARGLKAAGGAIEITAPEGGVLSDTTPGSSAYVLSTGESGPGTITVEALVTASLGIEVFDPPAAVNVGVLSIRPCDCFLPDPILHVDPPVSPTLAMSIPLTGQAAVSGALIRIQTELDTRTIPTGSDGRFATVVDLAPNAVNELFLQELDASGNPGPTVAVTVVQDSEPPSIFIDFPSPSANLTTATTDVAGRVGDRLSGFDGLAVMVNGVAAAVDIGIGNNGTFFVADLPINVGTPTLIEATASDTLGNEATAQITVLSTPSSGNTPTLVRLAGNGQAGPVNQPLPAAVQVQVNASNGAPVADKIVTFKVTRSDGSVTATGGPGGTRMLQVRTDLQGIARAFWTLGSDAGCGNNRVEATAAGVSGTAFFCASALPGAAVQVNVGSGNGQRVQVGTPATQPLRVWVNDSCNGVAGVPVVFRVASGGGSFGNQSSITAITGPTGHASAVFTLGPRAGNQMVTAEFPGMQTMPASFVLQGVKSRAGRATSFAALVLENSSQPVGGATCHLDIGGTTYGPVLSDAQGRFAFPAIQESGPAHLVVDGSTADSVGGVPVPPGRYPSLAFEVVVVAAAENKLPMPVLLPALDPANARVYDGSSDVELTIEDLEGLRMFVAAGSVTLADGTRPSPSNPVTLSLNRVNHDDVPMPMPDGVAPPLAWTLQPAGAHFDPPVEVRYPNVSGLPPGSVAYFLSFDHDSNQFEIVASGTVDEDGAEIVSDPGAGISKSGWGCNCPPYAITGECKDCDLSPNGCGPEGGIIIGGVEIPVPCSPLPFCSFMPACNIHDNCYATCGASKLGCDLQFLINMQAKCVSCFGVGNPLANTCQSIAWIYAAAVAFGGGSAYAAAQNQACWCEASSLASLGEDVIDRYRLAALSGWQGEELPPPPFTDADLDLLPDDWELMVGLNPNDPSDFDDDNDGDGLVNLREYFHQFHPFLVDSNMDGVDDLTEAEGFQDPAPLVLDDTWSVSVNGQTVSADPNGFFAVPNVSAVDQFGASGPGSAPDFISDDFLRVTASGEVGGTPMYAFSDPFQLRQGEILAVPSLTVTSTPPPLPESIRMDVAATVLQPNDQVQVAVTGTLVDGSQLDLTARASWTSYRSSNPAVVHVDNDGLVTAVQPGVGFVSATNDGAIASMRFVVAEDTITTQVEGVIVDEATGAVVAGADVSVVGFPYTAVSDSNGLFSIADAVLPADQATISVQASAIVGGAPLFGLSTASVVPGGTTDVGFIVLMFAPRLLVIGSEDPALIPASEFANTGFFEVVDSFDSRSGTPTISLLSSYDVVLNYTNFTPSNPTALGDVLADYVDQGGRLVICTYAFSSPWAVSGRVMTAGYSALRTGTGNGDLLRPIVPLLPADPVLANIDLATMVFFSNGNFARPVLDPGATLIATDSTGTLLMARNAAGTIVSLNLFPSLGFGNGPQLYDLMTNAVFSVLGAPAPADPVVPRTLRSDRSHRSVGQSVGQPAAER